MDSSTAGVKAITGLSLTLPPGLYWLAAVATGGTPTMTTLGAGSLPPCPTVSITVAANCAYMATTGGSLAAAFTIGGYAAQGVKVMMGI